MGAKIGPVQRKYGNHRDLGVIDVTVTREEVAEQVTRIAQWWQSDAVLLVAPDGAASLHLWGLIETDRLMRQRTPDVVGTFQMYNQSESRKAQIMARVLAELRNHLGAPGERRAA